MNSLPVILCLSPLCLLIRETKHLHDKKSHILLNIYSYHSVIFSHPA